jgi:hypothetical protein
MHGLLPVDIAKATGAGLTFRVLEETVADTLSWARTRSDAHAWQAGLQPDREAALLTLWRQQTMHMRTIKTALRTSAPNRP